MGKQRLALWLAQYLLCENAGKDGATEPCGSCQQCRYASRGTNPDIHWFFPRPRLKDGDASAEEIEADLREAIDERLETGGIWAAASGSTGIYVATVQALIKRIALRPALAHHQVFIIGAADRMVSQEGADQAANAFLKVLEEPPPNTTLILTTSEPGALLPTIRSRVVTVRVPPVSADDMDAFLRDSTVAQAADKRFPGQSREQLKARARGAPGRLFDGDSTDQAFASARALLEAAMAGNAPGAEVKRIGVAARQGVSGARGSFSDTLDALSELLHEHIQHLLEKNQTRESRLYAATLIFVEEAKLKAHGNVSPQLISAHLLTKMHQTLQS